MTTTELDAPLLTAEDVSVLLSIPVGTLAQWRVRQQGPAYLKLPNRAVRYRLADVQAWAQGAQVAR